MKNSIFLTVLLGLFLVSAAWASGEHFIADEMGFYQDPWRAHIDRDYAAMPEAESGWPQNPGWPQVIPAHVNFIPFRGVCLADINADGFLEIVASSEYKVYVFDYEGNVLSGWPVNTIEIPQGAPSVGDVDNDGMLEIVQGTRGWTSGGRLYVFEADGSVSPGFPVNFSEQNIAGSPCLYDLDRDGTLEIIVGTRNHPIGHLRVVRYDGSQFGGNWPVALDHVPTGTAAVGDVDNDGQPEIAYMSYNSIYLLNADGTPLSGFPWTCPWGNFSYQSIALHDLNGNGYLELICATHRMVGASGAAFVLDYQGNLLPGWPRYLSRWTYSPPSVVDLFGNGEPVIVVGASGMIYPTDVVYAFEPDGTILPGFPVCVTGSVGGPFGIGDLEGDGTNYIAFDAYISATLGSIYVCDRGGVIHDPYPLQPWGVAYMNGVQLGDLNRNGVMELVNISHCFGTIANINVWSERSFYGDRPAEWETYHADNHRTGLYNPMGGNQLPGHFNLIGPDSGFAGAPPIVFEWEAAIDPNGDEVNYWIVYDSTINMQNPTVTFVGTDTNITSDELEMTSGVYYYWYVTADDMISGWVTASNQKFWSVMLRGLRMRCEAITPVFCQGKNFYFKLVIDNSTGSNVSGILTFGGYAGYDCDPANALVAKPRAKTYAPGETLEYYFFKVPNAAGPGPYSASIGGTLCDVDLFCCMNVDIVQCEPWRIGDNTTWELVETDRPEVGLPTVTSLAQNYPNPFNAITNISYNLAEAGNVSLNVYDITGRLVVTLIDGQMDAGEHVVAWDASNVSSGVYFYKLSTGDFTEIKRMTLLR